MSAKDTFKDYNCQSTIPTKLKTLAFRLNCLTERSPGGSKQVCDLTYMVEPTSHFCLLCLTTFHILFAVQHTHLWAFVMYVCMLCKCETHTMPTAKQLLPRYAVCVTWQVSTSKSIPAVCALMASLLL